MAIVIRPEMTADFDVIDSIIGAAFGGQDEVVLVRRLRGDGEIVVALVAEQDGAVIGHVVLSRLETRMDGREVRGLALAPVSVMPGHQNGGTGRRLITESLAVARSLGWEAVIVLGHPSYYPRFGFSAGLAKRLKAPFEGEAFMAMELVAGALDGAEGHITYAAAFQIDPSH